MVLFFWAPECFGAQALSSENGWLLAGILRTSVAAKVKGGLSGAWRAMMRAWFVSDVLGASFASGISVHTSEGVKVIICELGTTLADESALNKVYNNKGASGIKICMLCQNVVSMMSELYDSDFTGHTVAADDLDHSHWCLHTNASLFETADLLAAAHLGPRKTKKKS